MLIKLLAQATLGVPFIILGYQAAKEPGVRVELAEDLGIPNPKEAVQLNGALMVVGGAALTLNVLPRYGALGLAASLVPTTLAGHPFWKFDDADQRSGQLTQFLKNMGLAGGLVAVAMLPRGKK